MQQPGMPEIETLRLDVARCVQALRDVASTCVGQSRTETAVRTVAASIRGGPVRNCRQR